MFSGFGAWPRKNCPHDRGKAAQQRAGPQAARRSRSGVGRAATRKTRRVAIGWSLKQLGVARGPGPVREWARGGRRAGRCGALHLRATPPRNTGSRATAHPEAQPQCSSACGSPRRRKRTWGAGPCAAPLQPRLEPAAAGGAHGPPSSFSRSRLGLAPTPLLLWVWFSQKRIPPAAGPRPLGGAGQGRGRASARAPRRLRCAVAASASAAAAAPLIAGRHANRPPAKHALQRDAVEARHRRRGGLGRV